MKLYAKIILSIICLHNYTFIKADFFTETPSMTISTSSFAQELFPVLKPYAKKLQENLIEKKKTGKEFNGTLDVISTWIEEKEKTGKSYFLVIDYQLNYDERSKICHPTLQVRTASIQHELILEDDHKKLPGLYKPELNSFIQDLLALQSYDLFNNHRTLKIRTECGLDCTISKKAFECTAKMSDLLK